jgi:hypothetical protein
MMVVVQSRWLLVEEPELQVLVVHQVVLERQVQVVLQVLVVLMVLPERQVQVVHLVVQELVVHLV